MARTYKRDSNGRFAGGGGSSGGGGGKRPAAKSVSRGVNRLTRDNAGKITSVGGSGATARGGRLKTAAGNKRAMQTAKVSGSRPAGTMKGKIKRDPGAAGKVGQGKAAPKLSGIATVGAKLATRDKATGRGDRAEANIKGRFSGQTGKRMDASIDRAVKQVKAANIARFADMKPKGQVKAERAANAEAKRQAAAANPKRVRSAESLRMSRAKQVEKRRGMNISNPAGERQDSAGRMAANAARTQQRATAFLKAKAKPSAASKPALNKIAASPRQLSKNEQIARDVMTDKTFRSDRQRVTEMQRRGIKPDTDIVGLVANVRAKQGGGTTSRIKPPATPKPTNAAPKATAKPKTGQEIMKAEVRKVQNKKLRDINAEIKAAGPNAINLRVEKLALQNNMLATQSRQTAKQVAKSEKQTQVVRGRIAEMRRDRERIGRAAANRTRNADVRNSAAPMSKASFAPRPSKKTIRSQNQADKALDFYANPTKALRTVSKRKPGFRLPRNMR